MAKAPLEVVRLAETFASIEASIRAIKDLFPTALELGYFGRRYGFGAHSRGELGYSDPTGNTVTNERQMAARDAARSATGKAIAALEVLNQAQDQLADVVSPRIRA